MVMRLTIEVSRPALGYYSRELWIFVRFRRRMGGGPCDLDKTEVDELLSNVPIAEFTLAVFLVHIIYRSFPKSQHRMSYVSAAALCSVGRRPYR